MRRNIQESEFSRILESMDRRSGPTIRPFGAIAGGIIMLQNLLDRNGDDESPAAQFTNGEIEALYDFIDPADTQALKKFADMVIVHNKYLALEVANRIKPFDKNSEKAGKLAACRWALKRRGAKLQNPFLETEGGSTVTS